LMEQNIEDLGGLEQPVVFLVAFGSILTFLSLCGFLGACCAIRRDGSSKIDGCCADRALMIYYVGIMTLCACMLYGGVLCLMYKDKASEYVDIYWTAINEVFDQPDPDAIKGHLRDGGVICLIGMFVNLLCAHFSAKVMGYQHTARRTMLTSNMVGLVLGVLLIVLAFLPGSREMGVKDGYLPHVIGSLGILASLLSVAGFLGAFFLSPCLLATNGVLLGLLAVLMLGFGAYALANADDARALVEQQWEFVRTKIYDLCPECEVPPAVTEQESQQCCTQRAGLVVWDNMSSLGLGACILLISMCVNVFFSFYLWREVRVKRRQSNYRSERKRLKPTKRGRRRRRDEEEDISSEDDL